MNLLAALNASWLFAAGCAVLSWVLLRRYFGLAKRSGRQSQDYMEHLHRPTGPWDGARQDSAALIERQKVELYDMARDVTGRLDSKMILLEQLLEQSQRQIERLEELLAQQSAEHAHS